METLIAASENFDKADFDEKTFLNFMQRVPIWDYYGLSKSDYVALPESEKRIKIYEYYIDLQQKYGTGECFYCLFLWFEELS